MIMEPEIVKHSGHVLRFVEAESNEWWRMWEKLSALPINAGVENPASAMNEGECWQYMGTSGGKHQFRHRLHPNTMAKEYAFIEQEN